MLSNTIVQRPKLEGLLKHHTSVAVPVWAVLIARSVFSQLVRSTSVEDFGTSVVLGLVFWSTVYGFAEYCAHRAVHVETWLGGNVDRHNHRNPGSLRRMLAPLATATLLVLVVRWVYSQVKLPEYVKKVVGIYEIPHLHNTVILTRQICRLYRLCGQVHC